MNCDDITPMILTFNEEINLDRTLRSIPWARQILIVDSFSTDGTLAIASRDPRVRVVQRKFDHFADQCNFGIANIDTPWVLSLDADYLVDQELGNELSSLDPRYVGFRATFRYAVFGRLLRSSLYPPRTVLYKRDSAEYKRDGHAHRVQIQGSVSQLKSGIVHDDRKPLSKWFSSQFSYAEREAHKLLTTSSDALGWKDRLRNWVLPAPILTLLYCLFFKGLLLDGWAGWFYTYQRVLAETTLSLILIQKKLDLFADHSSKKRVGE